MIIIISCNLLINIMSEILGQVNNFSFNLFILYQLWNKLSAHINHAQCLLPGDFKPVLAPFVWKNPKVTTCLSRDLWYERPTLHF